MFEPNGLHSVHKYQYELSWPVQQVLYKVSENLHPNMDDRVLAFAQPMITALHDSMTERIESSCNSPRPSLSCLGWHFQLKASRLQAAAKARDAGALVLQVEWQCAKEVAKQRTTKRLREQNDASEGTPELLSIQSTRRQRGTGPRRNAVRTQHAERIDSVYDEGSRRPLWMKWCFFAVPGAGEGVISPHTSGPKRCSRLGGSGLKTWPSAGRLFVAQGWGNSTCRRNDGPRLQGRTLHSTRVENLPVLNSSWEGTTGVERSTYLVS